MTKTTWMKSIANVTKHTSNELLLLPLSVRSQKTSALVDSGATHYFFSNNMLDIIKSALHDCVKWRHASEPLRVSLADNSVVLSMKIVVLSVQIGEHVQHDIEFHAAPRLNHPLILGLQWLRIANPTIDWSTINITLDGHTAPVVTGTMDTCSKHSATLCTTKQM